MKTNQKYLLSIDGGGIRGVLPICLLIELERVTGKKTREIFSFIAGTSTGAIIAAGLSAGIPASELLKLYSKLSDQIFTSSLLNPIRRFLFGSFYSTQKLHDLIVKNMSEVGDWTINDSPIDLLITAKRVKDGKPWYFVKDKSCNSQRTGKLTISDCATASAAAPTYFHPWPIIEKELAPGRSVIGDLIDGGVGVTGNPVYQLTVEAFYYSGGDYDPKATTIVSLGTGRFMQEKMPGWLPSWLEYILSELLRSPGEQQTELVQRHFPDTKFYRLDPDLKALDPSSSKPIPLDNAAKIPQLIDLGQRFVSEVNWEQILNGDDNNFKVTQRNTAWSQYKWPH